MNNNNNDNNMNKMNKLNNSNPISLQDNGQLYLACTCSIFNVISGLAGGKSAAEQVKLCYMYSKM